MELSTIQMALNNWTIIDNQLNFTDVNSSSFDLGNVSGSTLEGGQETPSPWLVYLCFALQNFLLAFGLFGNTSGVIVMLRLPGKLQTFGLLVAALAVTDMLGLTTNLFNLMHSPMILGVDVRARTDVGCIAFHATDIFAKVNSAYITVLICIDRFLAVQFPLKFKSMVTREVRLVSVCVCACVSLFIGLVTSIQYTKINNGICQLGHGPSKTLAQFGLRLMLFILATVIPMMILLSLTPVIIFRLKQRQTVMAKLTNKEEGTRLVRTSVMLTCVVVAYIILVGIPYAAFTVLRFRGVAGNASTEVMLLCIITSAQMNHAINICLYNISNKEFREEFLRLFGCSCSGDQTP